jgi:hypothetical protein
LSFFAVGTPVTRCPPKQIFLIRGPRCTPDGFIEEREEVKVVLEGMDLIFPNLFISLTTRAITER